ncbi:MAG: hypothetical protein OXF20_10910 [Gammaproteobacteria bacterium]|nr:hypothetical protein [Gammaproteobacteria bacterium]
MCLRPARSVRNCPHPFPDHGRRRKSTYLCRDCEKAVQARVDENLPRIYGETEKRLTSESRGGLCLKQ